MKKIYFQNITFVINDFFIEFSSDIFQVKGIKCRYECPVEGSVIQRV